MKRIHRRLAVTALLLILSGCSMNQVERRDAAAKAFLVPIIYALGSFGSDDEITEDDQQELLELQNKHRPGGSLDP